MSDAERIEQIRALELCKSALAAAQARVAVDFDTSRRAQEADRGVAAAGRGRGVGAEIALARRESPTRGSRHLGLARALVLDMPATMAALEAGQASEWTATLVCQATAILTAEDRRAVDAELANDLPSMSDRQAASAARAAAYRIDPTSVVRRVRGAESDRCVSMRPAPDCMARLSALLPVKDGVAVYAALRACADTARAGGDSRTQGQVMADTLTTRTTGYASPDEIPVQVNLVMSDTTLLAGGDDPGRFQGYGPVPAPLARHLATAP
ncbi:MAG TPA: DUF222 domain-containing protein, partial [Candidatus Lustribacter sp.]|nr:DUF222 domain-containing protein [Candidatus Lustribacter sp.]